MPHRVDGLLEYRDDGPVTKKVTETDRTIVTLVCLKPGQAIPPFTHRRREAFVYCLTGEVRVTPGPGPAELRAGDLESYDGSRPAAPSNPGRAPAAFLVTLVRKRDA
jgi:mannose-6-phosphate isomerase-like protein (cupin superfamily)